MRYQERRRAERAQVKARLLVHLKRIMADGEFVRLKDLVVLLHRSRSLLTTLWHELADEGLIDYPAEERLQQGLTPPVGADLERRIAVVREAKIQHWEKTGTLRLSEEELREVLP